LYTDNTKITVFFGPQPASQNGGSDILSYELQIDNGKGGNFVSLIGLNRDSLETVFTVSTGIMTGEMYRFRYRSKNINGNSGWSPIIYVKAATVPSRPLAPQFKTATVDSVTMSLFSSTETRGGEILSLEIWRNQGGISLDFVKVADLPNSAKEYTVKVSE